MRLRERLVCLCSHTSAEHEQEEGCLHGWGKPPTDGCPCDCFELLGGLR